MGRTSGLQTRPSVAFGDTFPMNGEERRSVGRWRCCAKSAGLEVLAVRVARRRLADVSLLYVRQHFGARPVVRIAPAAARTCDQSCDVAPAQMNPRTFAEPLRRRAVGTDDLNVIGRARLSARDTPGRELGAAERGSQEHAFIAQDPIVTDQAETATELPSTCIDRVERVLIDHDPVFLLADLSRDDVGLAVADADEARLPVLVSSDAPTAGLGLDQDHQLPGVGIRTGEDEPAD